MKLNKDLTGEITTVVDDGFAFVKFQGGSEIITDWQENFNKFEIIKDCSDSDSNKLPP